MRLPPKLVRSLACLGALSLGGCSYLWTYKYEVSVAADVSLDAGATLVMAQAPGDAGIDTIEDQPLAGYERCYVSDPFGNRIELMQTMPKAMQLAAIRSLRIGDHAVPVYDV